MLATIGTPMDRYRPLDVPEPWYTQAWYAEGVLAARAGDAGAAQQAFSRAVRAAADYQQGFIADTEEATALATFTGNTRETEQVQALAALAHEQLARLLATHDPAAAQQQRAAEPTDFRLPAGLLEEPFPELYGFRKSG